MTQQEKELLLKDLCARLLYGVKVFYHTDGWEDKNNTLSPQKIDMMLHRSDVIIKPHLRPISSMTDEEVEEIRILLNNSNCGRVVNKENFTKENFGVLWFTNMCPSECVGHTMMSIVIDYLNSIHVDYRGLIPMGLALEATEGLYDV